MGKWISALKSPDQKLGFGGFGGLSTGHIPEKKPSDDGGLSTIVDFGGFGGLSTGHIPEKNDLTKQGMARLEVAAAGLPITLDELAVIFADDLQDFGSGAVPMDGIRQACQWYARGRGELPQEPDNRVTCTACKQTGCPHPLAYGRHSSPQPRNCNHYTPFDGNVTAFRRAQS